MMKMPSANDKNTLGSKYESLFHKGTFPLGIVPPFSFWFDPDPLRENYKEERLSVVKGVVFIQKAYSNGHIQEGCRNIRTTEV